MPNQIQRLQQTIYLNSSQKSNLNHVNPGLPSLGSQVRFQQAILDYISTDKRIEKHREKLSELTYMVLELRKDAKTFIGPRQTESSEVVFTGFYSTKMQYRHIFGVSKDRGTIQIKNLGE